MKAYKCDRCGKLYEIKSNRRDRGIIYDVIDNFPGKSDLDLCDKCFDELQEWMTVYKETESEDKVMSYGDIYSELGLPPVRIGDELGWNIDRMKDIPNRIVVWLKDGSKVVYISESEDK